MEDNATYTAVLDRVEPDVREAVSDPATKVTDVLPLPYTRLRLLAECAVGVDNRDVDYYFEDTALYQGRPSGESADSAVVVHASDTGRDPLNTVTIQARYPMFVDGEKVEFDLTRTLELGVNNALLWSDAAVQKFVFPYVASCGGDNGAALLQSLQNAWNFYPSDRVTVYALVQENAFLPSAELDLDLSISVVYVATPDGQTLPNLDMMTLRDFGIAYPPDGQVKVTNAVQVPYSRGLEGSPQRPNYTVLRAMADWACCLRDTSEYFVFRAGGHGFESPLPRSLPLNLAPGDIVIPAHTPTVPAGRPTLSSVQLQPERSIVPSENLTVTADAAFWSTGSIEQYLFPYYASKAGFNGMKQLVDMIYAWTGKMPVLSGNDEVNTLVDELLRDGAPSAPTGDEVAGLIHLHTSEWVELNAEGNIVITHADLGRQLGVLTVHGLHKPRVERLDRFIARKRAGR
jgi:hypothetical protein